LQTHRVVTRRTDYNILIRRVVADGSKFNFIKIIAAVPFLCHVVNFDHVGICRIVALKIIELNACLFVGKFCDRMLYTIRGLLWLVDSCVFFSLQRFFSF